MRVERPTNTDDKALVDVLSKTFHIDGNRPHTDEIGEL